MAHDHMEISCLDQSLLSRESCSVCQVSRATVGHPSHLRTIIKPGYSTVKIPIGINTRHMIEVAVYVESYLL